MDAPSNLDHLYAPPRAVSLDEERRKKAERLRKVAWILAGASLGLFVLGFGALAADVRIAAGASFATAALLGLGGAFTAGAALIVGVGASAGPSAAALSVVAGGVNVVMTLVGALIALFATMSFSRGRQLRSFGNVLLPRVVDGDDWARPSAGRLGLDAPTRALDETTRRALARQWRENGRTEHASVAAFARLGLDLVALGAPPALVAAANRDALDEIRHAELCFALARELDGSAEGPGPFPEAARARTLSSTRALAFAELAVDSMIDGALHEGVSARIVARLTKRCADPAIRSVLKEIAADEGRHARHGWDVALWCLEQGGEPVAHALLGALEVLPERMASPLPVAASSGAWERFGIMGQALEAQEYAASLVDLRRRVTRAIADRRQALR